MANRDIQLVNCDFGVDANEELCHYAHEQIEFLEQSHSELHKNQIPKWRKIYLGKPAEENKSFPWPNAANTIVQIVGESVDNVVARVIELIYATHPLWIFQDFRRIDASDSEAVIAANREKSTLENFMDLVGYEVSEMDLRPTESLWYTDAAKLGTGFVKVTYENRVEVTDIGYTSSSKKAQGTESSIYSGPRVHKLAHEDVFMTPDANSPAEAEFVFQIRPLRRKALEERGFTGVYDQDKVDEILGHPDRSRPRPEKDEALRDENINLRGGYDATAEWDIYECYFPWWHNGKKFRIIFTYHKSTKTVLRRVFNFLPDNELPILRARLGYRTDGMYGHGFAELLERYQEEISTTHNQRLDNATAANTRALRVSPRAINLDSNFELYPFAMLVGEKDDIEALAIADVYPSAFENEELTLRHAQSRAGISPAIAGQAQGGMKSQRSQIYSSLGTIAAMQEGNSLVNLEVSDFRHAHVKLGSLLTAIYGKAGIGDRADAFGLDADALKSAFKEFGKHRLRIPIRAASASFNREVERQSDMLVVGLLQRHGTAIGQLMQSISNPMVPPDLQEYLKQWIVASNMFMKGVLKDFGYDQPDRYLPDPTLPAPPRPNQQGPMAPKGAPVDRTAIAAAQAGSGMAPGPGGSGVSPGPPQPPATGGGPPQQ
jgi:hypothetical protein